MPYEKTSWKDRQIQNPNTFTLQNNADGTTTLIPQPGIVTEQGTPLSAANLNKMEQGIEDAHLQKANKAQEAWIAPTLLNSWVNLGDSYPTAGYRKNQFGMVELRGIVTGGASGSVICVLPEGYRPAKTCSGVITSSTGTGRVWLYPTGNVTHSTGAYGTGNLDLGNISFEAGA
jgi:hypothetical protein